MAVIATHPDSRFPRAGVTVYRHDYIPTLTGIGHELASEIEHISQSDPDRQSGSTAWGHMRVLGGDIKSGILIAVVPRKHRVTDGEETWLITYAKGWVAAELHDSWESAGAVFDRHSTRLAYHDPGAPVVERHGYWLAADWDRESKFTWYRPNTWDPVPSARHVTTDQLTDDPGIRVWTEAQASNGRSEICGLIAPELMHDTLVGYPEMAQERGVTQQAMRSRVSYDQAIPTFPDVGALWSRPAARNLVAPKLGPDPTYYVEVVRVYGSEAKYHYVTGRYADDLPEEQALDVLAQLHTEAEAHGLPVKADRDHRWHVNGAEAVEACFRNGWLTEARARSNSDRPFHHPPAYVWADPAPLNEIAAPTKRGKPSKTRKQSRRGLLP